MSCSDNENRCARLAEAERLTEEWQRRAEMVWRQRDAADRRAEAAEARLAEVIAIHQETADGYCAECTSDYCGDAEPVTYPCATASAARGEGDR